MILLTDCITESLSLDADTKATALFFTCGFFGDEATLLLGTGSRVYVVDGQDTG